MATTTLGTPLADDGIRAVNFFNGRLLTGKDLSREQDARRLADRRLGQATGPGVAWGLEVAALAGEPPGRVAVSAGLALGRSGQTLWLAADQVLTLVQPPDTATASSGAGFAPCGVLSGSTYVAGDGVFLLTLAPASLPEGQAPVLALDAANTRCNTDAIVEAVQLRLLRINGWQPTGSGDAAVARLRNQIAYAAFAQPAAGNMHGQPGQASPPGLIDTLRGQGLSDCDVPLAVAYMVGRRIVFIDRWSVRRRLAADAATAAWSPWLGERRRTVAEAQLAQFQDQIADTPGLLTAAASAALDWLPAAGFLPAATDWARFLGSQAPAREVPLAAGDAPGVLGRALADDPVALGGATRLRVHRIGGSGGPLLFARDRRNDSHAEQVWLDGTRAGLPGVADVQAAIDTLRAGSCLHKVLRPDMDLEGFFAALPNAADVTLCFEPGTYALGRPLILTRLGRVRLHGHGATLVNTGGECALRVDHCAALDAQDIAFEGRVSGSGKDELKVGLYGALTVIDTPQIRFERVQARCADGATLGAAALVAGLSDQGLGEELAAPQVTVADCELTVGAGQLGLLVLNPDVAALRGNRVAAAGKGQSLHSGIVVAGSQAGVVQVGANVVRDAVHGISIALSVSTTGKQSALKSRRVLVEANEVELQLAGLASKRGRFGILVGSAESVRVVGNHIVASGHDEELPVHAIRLAGDFGPQIVVRDNLSEGTSVGTALQVAREIPPNVVWAFQYNVALPDSAAVVQFPSYLGDVVVLDHNQTRIDDGGGKLK